jgi:hypothetical protein
MKVLYYRTIFGFDQISVDCHSCVPSISRYVNTSTSYRMLLKFHQKTSYLAFDIGCDIIPG